MSQRPARHYLGRRLLLRGNRWPVFLAATLVCLLGLHASLRSEVVQQWTLHTSSSVRAACPEKPEAGRDQEGLAHIGQINNACTPQGNSSSSTLSLPKSPELVSPVVVVAYNRPQYLQKAMSSILRHWLADPANAKKFPLYISIDGFWPQTTQLAVAYSQTAGVQAIRNLRNAPHCAPTNGHCHLAMHYLMLVQLFFECLDAPRLIFVEEDLEVAPDFFSYFEGTAPLLKSDPSILCISAWNDHGQQGRAANATALYRTDVMPGLGWMLSAAVAKELLPGWINATQYGGWDEYLRDPCVRKGRQCLFPEVPRTHTFGQVGNSGGMFYEQHLANMVLHDKPLDWSKQDLSYLQQANYAALMQSWLSAAVQLNASTIGQLQSYCAVSSHQQQQPPDTEDMRDLLLLLTYSSHAQYMQYARQLAPMLGDISVGAHIPRASYNGTVIVRCRGRRLFLVASYPNAAGVCGS